MDVDQVDEAVTVKKKKKIERSKKNQNISVSLTSFG